MDALGTREREWTGVIEKKDLEHCSGKTLKAEIRPGKRNQRYRSSVTFGDYKYHATLLLPRLHQLHRAIDGPPGQGSDSFPQAATGGPACWHRLEGPVVNQTYSRSDHSVIITIEMSKSKQKPNTQGHTQVYRHEQLWP